MGLLDRLLGRSAPTDAIVTQAAEPKRLITLESEVKDTKASSHALLPQGAYGPNYVFFSPDGGRTMIDLNDGPTTLAFAAYWYVATRWRAQKIAEPPLMVVAEDQETGDDEWVEDHELVDLLEEPSDDYDMGELLETTSHYLDNTGACLWVKDQDRVGRIARLTPFNRLQFEPLPSTTRLFAQFRVQTVDGPETFDAEQCVFFRDFHGSQIVGWPSGRSRLDVAMSWLKLGVRAQQTIYDLLVNSVWPSVAILADKDWDPDPETLKQYQQDLKSYAKVGNKGKPFVMLGGGSISKLQSDIKNLVPDEILGRVESVVAAVSGVPAIVLQFQIGMENSPWSQMAQARKMAYDDVIQPSWRKMERILTRQLLRPIDDDKTHFLRFDASNVASLQQDQLVQVQIASGMGTAASLNERRAIMGLEPVDPAADPDGKADEIPELTQPSIAEQLAGGAFGKDPKDEEEDPEDAEDDELPKRKKKKDEAAQEEDEADPDRKTRRRWIERKARAASLQTALRNEEVPVYNVVAYGQLRKDADAITEIVMNTLLDTSKSVEGEVIEVKARGKDRVMDDVDRYLKTEGRKSWTRALEPLTIKSASRAGAVTAADLGVNLSVMQGNLLQYAKKRAGVTISNVSRTTRSMVGDIIQGGIDAKASTRDIARLISEATGFSKSRSMLIARTETTAIYNGAPAEALAAMSRGTNRTFTKTWSTVLDDRVRDEHADMEGETVEVDQVFSNDLPYPSEPNCRCVLLYDETTED